MASWRRALETHLATRQVTGVIYGAVIGLALVVTLQAHPPGPGTAAAALLATAVAVGLAEIYSEMVGAEARFRRRIDVGLLRLAARDAVPIMAGAGFPAIFFLLAVADVIETKTAFNLAKWSGLGLLALYGFVAARLAGAGRGEALVHAAVVGTIGGALIGFKALLH